MVIKIFSIVFLGLIASAIVNAIKESEELNDKDEQF